MVPNAMRRRVLPIFLVAAVVLYPVSLVEAFESPLPGASLCWSGESYGPVPNGTSPEAHKDPALAPVSGVTAPSSAELYQRPFFKDSERDSNLGGSCPLIRAPPSS